MGNVTSPMDYITLKTTYNIIQWIIRKKNAYPVGRIYFNNINTKVTFDDNDVLTKKDINQILEDFYPILRSIDVIEVEKDFWTIQFSLRG